LQWDGNLTEDKDVNEGGGLGVLYEDLPWTVPTMAAVSTTSPQVLTIIRCSVQLS